MFLVLLKKTLVGVISVICRIKETKPKSKGENKRERKGQTKKQTLSYREHTDGSQWGGDGGYVK